jgi:hypothetical protein
MTNQGPRILIRRPYAPSGGICAHQTRQAFNPGEVRFFHSFLSLRGPSEVCPSEVQVTNFGPSGEWVSCHRISTKSCLQHHPLQYDPHDVPMFCPQRHPYPNFGSALRNRVGGYAV